MSWIEVKVVKEAYLNECEELRLTSERSVKQVRTVSELTPEDIRSDITKAHEKLIKVMDGNNLVEQANICFWLPYNKADYTDLVFIFCKNESIRDLARALSHYLDYYDHKKYGVNKHEFIR